MKKSMMILLILQSVLFSSSPDILAHKPVTKSDHSLVDNYMTGQISTPLHKFYAGGFRYIVDAEIDDFVDEARVYFKDLRSPTYQVYAKMSCVQGRCYASLPVSDAKLEVLEYFIAYRDRSNHLYKTSKLKSIKRDMLELPVWQRAHQDRPSEVYTEYPRVPSKLRGFRISFNINITSRLDVFGVKFGLYGLEDIKPIDDLLNADICNQCEKMQIDKL